MGKTTALHLIIALFFLAITCNIISCDVFVSLPQKPVAVTVDLIDIRIFNSQEAFFEAEIVIIYEWKNDTINSSTPEAEIVVPKVSAVNKVKNTKTYPDKIIVLEDSIQRIVREVCRNT